MRVRVPSIALIVLLSAPFARAQDDEEPPSQGPATAPDTEPPADLIFPALEREDIHGFVWTRYRIRSTYDETDQDLLQNALLDVGDPLRHRVTFSFLGEWSWDLDGQQSPSDLFQIEDTFDSSVNGRLLHAYADVNRLGAIERVRVGRQELDLVPEVPAFDGVDVRTTALTSCKLRLAAFGGIPTHLYEASPDGDSLYGGGLQVEPVDGTWGALNVARIKDQLTLSTEGDTFVIAEVRQRLGPPLTLSGRLTALDENVRDLRLRAFFADAESGWRAQFSYFALFHTQRHTVTEGDPFFDVLAEERPFQDGQILLAKDLGETWTLEGGVALRVLSDDDDEGVFNRDYQRYFVTPTIHDWPLDRMDLSVTAEVWKTDEQEISTVGFDASHEVTDDLRVDLGSAYALFKFDPLLGGEREQVRTVYLRGKYDIVADVLIADVGVDLERDDRDTYRTLRVGLLWRF